MLGNSILDELEYDQSSGALTYKGVRYLLIRPETITGIQREIEKVKREEVDEGFYKGGFRGGYLSSKKYREIFNFSDSEIMEFMMKMGTEIGWGRFTLDHYHSGTGTMRITVRNSPFAESYGKSSEGVCHLIRGVVAGMASVLFDKHCSASEVNCIARGDDSCVFIVDAELMDS